MDLNFASFFILLTKFLVMTKEFRFRIARFQHDYFTGYWVTLYLIFDGYRTYTFYNESDWMDNSFLMKESGTNVHMFCYDVLCTPTCLPDLYNKVSSLCV